MRPKCQEQAVKWEENYTMWYVVTPTSLASKKASYSGPVRSVAASFIRQQIVANTIESISMACYNLICPSSFPWVKGFTTGGTSSLIESIDIAARIFFKLAI